MPRSRKAFYDKENQNTLVLAGDRLSDRINRPSATITLAYFTKMSNRYEKKTSTRERSPTIHVWILNSQEN